MTYMSAHCYCRETTLEEFHGYYELNMRVTVMVVNHSDSQNKRSYNDICTAVLKVTDYGPARLNKEDPNPLNECHHNSSHPFRL